MIVIKDIRDYGPIEIQLYKSNNSNFPKRIAEQGHGDKRTRFFEVWDACGVADGCLEAFTSYKAAKKFCQRYMADPEGILAKRSMLSGNRATHVRATQAIDHLNNWCTNFDVFIVDLCNPALEAEYIPATFLGIERMEPEIVFGVGESARRFSGIKEVRQLARHTFQFETYQGKVYTIIGNE